MTFYNAWRTVSSTSSDSYKEDFQAFVDAEFEDSPTIKTVKHNGVNVVVRVVGKFNIETVRRNNDNYQKIIFKTADYSVVIGDLFEFYGSKWLCTDINFTSVSKSCSVTKTNNTLKFYDESHILYEINCIINKGNIGLDENKFFSLPADEDIVVCPNTANSLKINENTRFILSGDAYSVIGVDKISNLGLLNIRIKEDLLTSDDNLDLGIANYYSNQIVKTINILNGTSASLLYTNATLQLEIEAKDNGVVVSNPIVTYSSNNVSVCTVSTSGLITAIGTGDAVVTATYGAVSDSIAIHSKMVVNNNYNIVITPSDTTLKLSRNIVFTATSMNNGVVDSVPRNYIWSISNVDGSSNVYATLTPNNDTCTVTASNLSIAANKDILIRVSFAHDLSIYTERQIQLVSLF